jgi:hypothetical protein
MSYITVDDRPANPLVMLIDNTDWLILAAISTSNMGVASMYVSPEINYADFLQIQTLLQNQNLAKSIALSGSVALSVIPFIAEAYTNNAVPSNLHYTLKASVQGFNGNMNVNSVTLKDQGLQTLNTSLLAGATSITLTITTS